MITVKMILTVVAKHHGLCVSDLKSNDKRRCFAWPRQEAFYIAHRVFDISLARIGREMSKDHTTVLSGIRNIEGRMLEGLRNDLDAMSASVRSEELVQMGGMFRTRNSTIQTGAMFVRHPSRATAQTHA
jgi:hypothetical protein